MKRPAQKSQLEPWQEEDAKRLRALFEERPQGPARLSQEQFADRYKIGTQAMLWQLLRGHRPLNVRVAVKFAAGLGCNVSDFSPTLAAEIEGLARTGGVAGDGDGGRSFTNSVVRLDHGPLPAGRVPVVGTAQLGDDGFWTELGHPVGVGDGFLDVPSADRNAYAVRVVGDSMFPRIRSGEFVVCEPNHAYGPGDEVLVITADGRSMVKELLYERDGQLVLHSVNDGHGRLTLNSSEVEKIHYVAAIVKSARWRQGE